MLVAEQPARRRIARDVDVGPAVVVVVGGHRGHGVRARRRCDPRLPCDVCERPVAVVPEQLHESGRQAARPTVHGNALPGAIGVLSRLGQLFERRVHVGGDTQVQVSVAVVVHPRATGAVADGVLTETGLLRHVGKCAVAVVVVEDVVAVVGDKQIIEPVVVVVTNCHGRGPARPDQAGLCRDVRERAVAVVLVQPVGRARRRALQPRAVQHEQIRASHRCRSR